MFGDKFEDIPFSRILFTRIISHMGVGRNAL